MIVVALIGAFTAFMAATIAITQNDIKRVVAYSTLSQLGYMCFALGTGAWIAAIFHLMTHAFFKGLLFLGSGSVIHGLHEEQNIQRMGGLRKYMPLTTWTFVIAAAANAGVFPLAGFWSKDEILVGSWVSSSDVGKLVSIVGFVSAFLTALYMFRLVFLTFFGRERFDAAEVHPHEAPATMAVPLVLLAIPAAVIGFVGVPPEDGPIHHFLGPVFEDGAVEEGIGSTGDEQASLYVLAQEGEGDSATEEAAGEEEHHVSTATTWTFGILSTIVALSGIGVAYLFYLGGQLDPRAVTARFPAVYEFLFHKWYFDEIYDRLFVQPLRNLAVVLWRVVDEGIIDATVNWIANAIGALSQRLRHVQTGLVANYALEIALGMVLLVGIYLAGFSDLFR
jgi:NADH-quinone oxidoreductase subunit L